VSITPEWAPNIHPLIVHFPIALLVSAALVDLASLLTRNRPGLRDAATLLYCAGAAAAIVAYFTGRNAETSLLLPAEVNPFVDEHEDWAFRTTWFFGFFASVRLAVSYIIRPKTIALPAGVFFLGLVGIFMLYETAEHGGELVFAHGVGVQKATEEEAKPELSAGATAPGIILLDAGSWVWRPVEADAQALANEFKWLENDVSHLAPGRAADSDKGSVLGLHPHGMPVTFVGGPALGAVQTDVNLKLAGFDGAVMVVFHVQDKATYDFFAVGQGMARLGREQNGSREIFQEKKVATDGWLSLRAYGGAGHFRGYVNGELVTHGHAKDLPPGPVGLRIDGTGTVLVEQVHVQAAE
jgi:uncharacterized membrane protein